MACVTQNVNVNGIECACVMSVTIKINHNNPKETFYIKLR